MAGGGVRKMDPEPEGMKRAAWAHPVRHTQGQHLIWGRILGLGNEWKKSSTRRKGVCGGGRVVAGINKEE